MPAGEDNRPQRTYLRRRGRMTRGQARALEVLAPRYCLDPDLSGGFIDPARAFGRDAPFGVEIGFGMGQALVEWARRAPDWNLLGLEVYQPGIGSALLALEREGLDNVRVMEAAAEVALAERLAPASVDEARVFFPDPWPKKRHHKRRLLQHDFAALLASRLKPGGIVWVATDWEGYAEWIVEVLDAQPLLARDAVSLEDQEPAADRPRTRFEARGRRLGHRVWDLRYSRNRASTESR